MNVTLSIIPYEDKIVLSNLIQLYRYDSSEFDGHVLGQHGTYSYKYLDHQWTEDYRRPLIVKVDGEIAGFVLIILDAPGDFTKLSTADKTNVISDFFIMRKFRRKGIGKTVAFSVFDQFKGVWEVRQTYENKPAYAFWKKVISEYADGSSYQEEMLENELWNGPVIVFKS
ncbi:GNAT family N-acetyltransferase [Sporosarcina sp. ACRSL]|uniref:GNAT family N-acetyltransferase n=1 Tax=Sporosarcina sp. ACRSL TaxID=2918215 RepID=UPI001EF6CDC3|nr:GNAT family N-acetyltransferase [Sporosarcina sp. ACRSL]MCG7344202.1 GNAT family N-acetyltransferase [Sporosarcina sp. ACRSL]